MSKPFMKVSDFTKAFMNNLKALQDLETLVGIPSAETERKPEKGESSEITNAALLFINEFGSPAQNIPARPVMKIGIKNAQDSIGLEFKKAAQTVLSKGPSAVERYYERAGIIASNSVKKVINDQEGIEHISFATALNRLRKGFKGDKALIVTGQMRNAITYVVRNKKGF